MKIATTFLVSFALVVLTCSTAVAQAQKTSAVNPILELQYGPNYEEILDKYGDNPVKLLEAEQAFWSQRYKTPYFDFLKSRLAGHSPHIGRSEVEPNNFFDTADNINDVLALPGRLAEYNGKLIEATLEQFDGHRANSARALGIGLRTLSGKLKSYGYAPRAKVPTGG